MMVRTLTAAVCVAAMVGSAASALSVDARAMLGQINNIVLNDHSAASETEGTLYVGGNFSGNHVVNGDKLPEFTVGGATGSVVIGGSTTGKLTSNNGSVIVGGSNSGQIVANGASGSDSVTVGGANSGKIQTSQPGTISIGRGNAGSLNAQPSGTVKTNTGVVPQIPAREVKAAFQTLSTDLSLLTTTSGASATAKSITAGTESFAVLNLTSDFFKADGLNSLKIDPSQTLIVNVAGKKIDIKSNWNAGNKSNVLFNFYEAEKVSVNRLFRASILAPSAEVKVNSDIWGTLVSHDLKQNNGQVIPYDDNHPFSGTIPPLTPVPLPASVLLLLGGVTGLGMMKLRRRA
jgi:choice-of-anchor A domain-containing protein